MHQTIALRIYQLKIQNYSYNRTNIYQLDTQPEKPYIKVK